MIRTGLVSALRNQQVSLAFLRILTPALNTWHLQISSYGAGMNPCGRRAPEEPPRHGQPLNNEGLPLRKAFVRFEMISFSSGTPNHGPRLVGVQGSYPSVEAVTGLGGEGGTAHGIVLKSKKSVRFG